MNGDVTLGHTHTVLRATKLTLPEAVEADKRALARGLDAGSYLRFALGEAARAERLDAALNEIRDVLGRFEAECAHELGEPGALAARKVRQEVEDVLAKFYLA